MLAEFSVEPIGDGTHLGATIAGIVEAVRRNGIEHQVTAMETLLEGAPAKIWDLLRLQVRFDRAAYGFGHRDPSVYRVMSKPRVKIAW